MPPLVETSCLTGWVIHAAALMACTFRLPVPVVLCLQGLQGSMHLLLQLQLLPLVPGRGRALPPVPYSPPLLLRVLRGMRLQMRSDWLNGWCCEQMRCLA